MRLRRLAAVAALSLPPTVVGCSQTAAPPDAGKAAAAAKSGDNPNVDVGQPLFPGAPAPTLAAAQVGGRDPLVVGNCTVQYEERQQVSAEVDGKIEMLATPWPAGVPVDPKDTNLVYHPRDVKHEKPYKKVKDGDPVKVGQIIGLLDDQLVNGKMKAAVSSRAASEEVKGFAEKGVKLSDDKYALSKKSYEQGVLGLGELFNDLITLSRFQENLAQAKQSIAKATSEYDEAEVMLSKHQIRSQVNGFIRSVSRQPGEFVKQGEKILEIQATDTVRVEGNLDVQYAGVVKRGTPVTVEPATPIAPEKSQAGHRQEVTGIAVSANPKRPLVVSAGADGGAVVWDVAGGKPGHALPHPVAVRSVACTPATSPLFRAVTGADDGKVRVWDLSNPDALPTAPACEGQEAHAGGVQAVAFSPDGRHFATASGREIFVWATETGKKLYAVPTEHRDTVTSLTITQQGTLVSASRDRSIKVWKLGTEKAGLARSIDHRSGAVDGLAVSADGGRVLFDQDKGRLDVVNLADKQTVSTIQTAGGTAAFATLAMFSPDDQYVLTGGGEGEVKGGLQVWTNPAPGGRGAELARLVAPGRAGITCAAFAPAAAGEPFLVAGTSAGTVHLWKPPGESARKAITGTVTKIDATDPRYVTVRFEVDNRTLGLLDRSAATVIINPAGK